MILTRFMDNNHKFMIINKSIIGYSNDVNINKILSYKYKYHVRNDRYNLSVVFF